MAIRQITYVLPSKTCWADTGKFALLEGGFQRVSTHFYMHDTGQDKTETTYMLGDKTYGLATLRVHIPQIS